MPKTNLIIHIVIEDDPAIAKNGTISVSRGDLGHLRAFKTTKASDTVYAIEQAVKELAELERKEPAKPAKSKSKPKTTDRSNLDDAPETDEMEDTAEPVEDETAPDLDDLADSPAEVTDDLNYDLIKIMGIDQTPAAYKHAVLLAEALRTEKLWNNHTAITFDNPIEAWTQLQAGSLSLQDVINLYTTTAVSPIATAAPTQSEALTAQPGLL